MLIELGQAASLSNSQLEELGHALPMLLRLGEPGEASSWIQQHYQIGPERADALVRLLQQGLPLQMQDDDGDWLTFSLRQGDEAVTQHILLEAIRSLAQSGRLADAAHWYATEFSATPAASWDAVGLMGASPVPTVEPTDQTPRRRGRPRRRRWMGLLIALLIVSIGIGVFAALVLYRPPF